MFARVVCLLLGLAGLATAQAAANLIPADLGGGALSPPVVRGNYLYVGTGATLSTWSLADTTHPVPVSRTADAPAPGPVRALAPVGNYLYAAWNSPAGTGGLRIYALTDPAHPALVATVDDYVANTFKRPAGLATDGRYVYLGDSENGLIVFDALDPLHPVVKGTCDSIYTFDSMALYGTRVYASGIGFIGGVIGVVDVANPAAPVLLGSGGLDSSYLRAGLADGYAIAVGVNLGIYDLHDPTNITRVFDAPIDTATQAFVHGTTLYLVGATGVQVWNFATPATPTLVRTVDLAPTDTLAPDQVADTSAGPLILSHTDRGLLLDATTPQQPTLRASFPLPFGVAVHAGDAAGDKAYFAEEAYGVGVADVPGYAPVARYAANLPPMLYARDMEDISVDNNRAYVAAWGYGVLIADLTNPAQPTELGRFEFPFASAIEAHGNRVYVASTTNGGILRVLDVSTPSQPVELGAIATIDTFDLTLRGTDVYIADQTSIGGTGGFGIVDASNPAAMQLRSRYTACDSAYGLDASADGNRVYVACADGSVHILDATNRAQPQRLGLYRVPGSPELPDYNVAHAVLIDQNLVYIAHEDGVDEVDMTDPAHPVAVARHSTGYFVSHLSRGPGGKIYAYAQEAGVYVYTADRIFRGVFE